MDGRLVDVATNHVEDNDKRMRRIMWWSRGCGWLCL
jgi:hypothetical protein